MDIKFSLWRNIVYFLIHRNNPVKVQTILFNSSSSSFLSDLSISDEIITIFTPYYENLNSIVNKYDKIIFNLISINSGTVCESNIFVYGFTPYHIIYNVFHYLLFKINVIIYIGDDNDLGQKFLETTNYFCVGYINNCKLIIINENSIELIKDQYENYPNSDIFIIYESYTKELLYNINTYLQEKNRRSDCLLILFNKYMINELISISQLNFYYIENYDNSKSTSTILNYLPYDYYLKYVSEITVIWKSLTIFKSAYEYTLLNDYPMLWAKIQSLITDYNNQLNITYAADNHIFQYVNILKYTGNYNSYTVFGFSSPMFNIITYNFYLDLSYRKYFYSCEIISHSESYISNKSCVHVVLLASLSPQNYNNSIYSRVSYFISIAETIIRSNRYIRPIYLSVSDSSEESLLYITNSIKKFKDDYNISINHIFGIFSESIYEPSAFHSDDILYWSTLIHTGDVCKNNMYILFI